VKVNKTGARGFSVDFSKGRDRFTATNIPLGPLFLIAYNITVRQIAGAETFPSERYDIVAKAEHPVNPGEMLLLLQRLLADRFKLVVRRETREVPVYALTIAKGGPRLRPTDMPESEVPAIRTPAHAGGTEPTSGHLVFKGESMADFAWALSRTAGSGDRVVVDETGLRGAYDFELTFERERAPVGAEVHESQGPSVFAAVQEQLGLKLEAKKAPVEFLIVDHVERPSDN